MTPDKVVCCASKELAGVTSGIEALSIEEPIIYFFKVLSTQFKQLARHENHNLFARRFYI